MNQVFTSIGNACTDIIANVDDDFLRIHKLRKGFCTHLENIYELNSIKKKLINPIIVAGGAGANVCHVISALGGDAHFIAKIADDAEGKNFIESSNAASIKCHFPAPLSENQGSPQVLVLITNDGERTFASFNGVASSLSAKDYNFDLIKKSGYLYLDGYCYSSPYTNDGFILAAQTVRAAGGKVIFNVGDISLYETNKIEIDALLTICDGIICNAQEALAFFDGNEIEQITKEMSKRFMIGAITNGANGAMVMCNGEILHIPAINNHGDIVLDTNGAGDHFSGGFIYGLMNGYELGMAGKLGALCANDCIKHVGARPEYGAKSLKHLIELVKTKND